MGLKQVIVMRTDLNMRKGKMIAQGAHATWLFMLRRADLFSPKSNMFPSDVQEWIENGTKKICVQAKSEEELNALFLQARKAGLRAHLVTDAGHTEFNGVPTVTCLAIGPNEDEAVDKITGELKLL